MDILFGYVGDSNFNFIMLRESALYLRLNFDLLWSRTPWLISFSHHFSNVDFHFTFFTLYSINIVVVMFISVTKIDNFISYDALSRTGGLIEFLMMIYKSLIILFGITVSTLWFIFIFLTERHFFWIQGHSTSS